RDPGITGTFRWKSRQQVATNLEEGSLQPKQPFLPLEPAAVAGEAAARADDAVARKDDRDRVPVHDGADGSSRLRGTDPSRESAVRRCVAVLDARELGEDALMELGRGPKIERKVERMAIAGEVLVELATDVIERGGRAEDARTEAAREVFELPL